MSAFVRAPAVLAAAALMIASMPAARAQGTPAAFEVASVKVNVSGRPFGTLAFQPAGFTATSATVAEMIRSAYGLQPAQLVGAPDWASTTRFDVAARAPAGTTASPAMLQALLAVRFGLRIHTETRELPLFALVTARSDGRPGPQLRPSALDCAAVRGSAAAAAAAAVDGREVCDAFTGPAPRMSAAGVSMAQLAASLARHVRQTVVDRTGLPGGYDFEMQWTPDRLPPRPAGSAEPLRLNGFVVDPDGPSIFTALQEQLGLKLDSQSGQLPVVVVDAVSPPTAD
jgi:uncharacterized protein (TIGR03435 family)